MSSFLATSGSGSTMIVDGAPLNVAKSTRTGSSGLPARVWMHAARVAGSASGPPGAVIAAALCWGAGADPAAPAANTGELAGAAAAEVVAAGAAAAAGADAAAAGARAAAAELAPAPNWVRPGNCAAAPGTL